MALLLVHRGGAPGWSLLLMSGFTTRSDGCISYSLYCFKMSSGAQLLFSVLKLQGQTLMINALLGFVSHLHCGDTDAPHFKYEVAASHLKIAQVSQSTVGLHKID